MRNETLAHLHSTPPHLRNSLPSPPPHLRDFHLPARSRMASSASGQDSIDQVYGPLERDESNAAAAAAATADAEPPPPPPAPPVDVLQERVHERPNDGEGSPSQAAAAAAADRKGKKVLVASSSSSSSNSSPASPASASGGEESRVIDGKQVKPQTVWPNKDSSLWSKVKGGIKIWYKCDLNPFSLQHVLAGITRQMRFNRSSTPSAPQVAETVIHITDMIEYYEFLVGEGKILNSNEQELHRAYSGFRPVLGDGECFYRSFIFSYLEQVIDREDTHEENRLLAAVKEVAILHATLGWNSNFSKSYKAFKKMIQKVKRWKRHSRWKRVPTTNSYRREKLLKLFSSYDATKHVFAFLRLVAAIWICSHQEEYTQRVPDLSDVYTLRHWCFEEVIPARIDADHVQMTALATALRVPLRVEDLLQGFGHPLYTGQGRQGRQDRQDPADHEVPSVTVLYVNRHYDIIYRRHVEEGCIRGTGPRSGESSPSSDSSTTGYSLFWGRNQVSKGGESFPASDGSSSIQEGEHIGNGEMVQGGLSSACDQESSEISNPIQDIPLDALQKILLRVPDLDTAGGRDICLSFRSVLDDEIFLLQYARHWSPRTILLFKPEGAEAFQEQGPVRIEALNLVSFDVHPLLRIPAFPPDTENPRGVQVHGCCEGILLLSCNDRLLLCNPHTGHWGLLPPIHLGFFIMAFYTRRRGFHEGGSEFMILSRTMGLMNRTYIVQNLSTKDLVRREIGLPLARGTPSDVTEVIEELVPSSEYPPAIIDDNPHWLLPYHLFQANYILKFDAGSEEFSKILLPEFGGHGEYPCQVFAADGHLGMGAMDETSTRLNIWILEEHWNLRHQILLPINDIEAANGFNQFGEPSVIVVHSTPDIMIQCPEVVLLMDSDGDVIYSWPLDNQDGEALSILYTMEVNMDPHGFMPNRGDCPFFEFVGCKNLADLDSH